MEDIYVQAIQEIEDTGKLLLMTRQLLCAKQKERNKLALFSMEKILSEWPDSIYPKNKVAEILTYMKNHGQEEWNHSQIMNDLLEDIQNVLKTHEHFMLGYLYQAFAYMIQNESHDNHKNNNDEDLEYEELDTIYCACMIYKYEDESANENARKQREADFWIWYLQTLAQIQGTTLLRDIHFEPKTEAVDFSLISTVEELVKAISYEFDYLSHEVKDDMITIQVFNLKNGAYCPTCHQFSNRVKFDYGGIMKLGKIKGISIRLYIKNNVYFCDNKACEEESFMCQSKVDYKERMANYKQLVKTLGNKRILEILQIK